MGSFTNLFSWWLNKIISKLIVVTFTTPIISHILIMVNIICRKEDARSEKNNGDTKQRRSGTEKFLTFLYLYTWIEIND